MIKILTKKEVLTDVLISIEDKYDVDVVDRLATLILDDADEACRQINKVTGMPWLTRLLCYYCGDDVDYVVRIESGMKTGEHYSNICSTCLRDFANKLDSIRHGG